jgi:hypothetical protein
MMRLALLLAAAMLAGCATPSPTATPTPKPAPAPGDAPLGPIQAYTVTVPDWGSLTFDAPALTKVEETANPKQFRHMATAGRFNVSVFVEPPGCDGGITHEAVSQCHGAKLARFPGLMADTLMGDCTPRFCRLVYATENTIAGTRYVLMHVNLLFAARGKWVDVHASIVNPTEDDVAAIQRFGISLVYS